MSHHPPARIGPGFVTAFSGIVALVVGLPAVLVALASRRFGHASPLDGVKAPWHWTADDLQSWGHKLTQGLDSSADLVDLFLRAALVAGWVCTAILVYTVVDEVVFQIRHGMPSARQRRFGGLGPIGRKLATALVAVLPLSISSTPALIGASWARPVATVIRGLPADVGMPIVPAPVVPDEAAGAASEGSEIWSLVEVRRGDSVWAIAERVANGRDVAAVAEQIVTANLGAEMIDGRRFTTPALIEPGWLLSVPGPTSPALPLPSADPPPSTEYVVMPGDSYWVIAEDHLGPSASGSEIAAYTEQLMSVNATLLGRSDPRLIRPGDVVQLGQWPPPAVPLPDPVATEPAPLDVTPVVAGTVPPVITEPAVAVAPSTTEPAPPSTTTAPVAVPGSSPTLETPASGPDLQIIDRWSDDGISVPTGLGAATLLAGGALAALGARRRRRLRSAHVGARLAAPAPRAVHTERILRSLGAPELLARLDLAVRSAAPELAAQQVRVLAAEVADTGEVRLFTDRPAMVAARWSLDIEAGAWRLPAEVSLGDLADDARRANQPCPAMLHLGESSHGQVFVDLEAVGLLSIDADQSAAESMVRCAAASLAVSPFAESSRVVTVGLGHESRLGTGVVESHVSLTSAIESMRGAADAIAAATSGSATTFALRASLAGGEAWEPSLLLCLELDRSDDAGTLTALVGGGGRGVGVMVGRPVPGSGAVLRADGSGFVLEPLGIRLRAVGLSAAEVTLVDELLQSVELAPVIAIDTPVEAAVSAAAFSGREHRFLVRVLGQVEVRSHEEGLVAFERSKAQELVVWLSQHRHRPTRSSARTALWETSVRDATFSNVVSDARRAMAKVLAPPPGQEWIGRTMNEDLPLHDLVVSDVELLADRVAAARGLAAVEAIDVLRPGVALIEGMPFAGTSYLWPDAEGITSALVLLATSAAASLASHYLDLGDVDGVFWATGQGLKVLAGHEELIALRMRAHADRGDLSGVRSEWESYERALQADSWAAAEPSPKLVELRRELLSPSLAS